nr:MAG TPA: hypothetical protein [Caudoviricetes sp.]
MFSISNIALTSFFLVFCACLSLKKASTFFIICFIIITTSLLKLYILYSIVRYLSTLF